MKLTLFDHNAAGTSVPKKVRTELVRRLEQMPASLACGQTKEFRLAIGDVLKRSGWTDRVPITASSKISITAINDGVGMCVQLGNMARFYADLLKLEVLHSQKRIHSAIYLLPTRNAAKQLGKNVANFERLVGELPHYSPIIRVPLLVIGLENEDS